MKKMGKSGIVGIVFCVAKTCLLGATHFNLPAGTPGRQEEAETGKPALVEIGGKLYEQVVVPYTTCELFFPIDGSQPEVADVGEWSGAGYVGQDNDEAVTDWWIRVFGGNRAVELSHVGQPDILPATIMGFDRYGNPEHIIQVMREYTNFERKFWSTFRVIASTAEGRVLLYRLLIEVRRMDDTGCGCCGPDIYLSDDFWLEKEIRNFFRSVAVCYDATGYDTEQTTSEVRLRPNAYKVPRFATKTRTTEPSIIVEGLFHELRRWFCLLRNPGMQNEENAEIQLP